MKNFFDRFNRQFSMDIDMPLMTDLSPRIEVKATYRDGVLNVELVKIESSAHKAKKIPFLCSKS